MHTVVSFTLATVVHGQAPFSLDTTFRTSIQNQYVNSIHLLSDGCVFLSGNIRFPGDVSFRGSAKLLANGQRDLSFPSFPLTTGGGEITPWNDRFYVDNGLVRRMTPEGLIDPSFIMMNNGPYFTSLQPGDHHVYPDGRVLLSGKHTLDDTARGFVGNYNLIWFSNTGYLDTTRTHRKGNGIVWFFEELPDGKFICHSTCTVFEGVPVDMIFRTDAGGMPDTTFNTGVTSGQAFDYYALPDSRVYVGGNFTRGAEPSQTLQLVRFMPDGSLDPTFNNVLQFGGEGISGTPKVNRMVPFGADKFFVLGHYRSVNGEPRGGISVVDTTGQLLPYFDGCGGGLFTYMGLTAGSITSIVPTSDTLFYYVSGRYTGYDDGTTNDTLQRFVTRLHVGDFTTGASSALSRPGFSLYPNPSSGNVTLRLEHVPRDAQLVLRDALSRVVLRQRLSDHYTTLALAQSGVYLLELWDGDRRIATQRVVVE